MPRVIFSIDFLRSNPDFVKWFGLHLNDDYKKVLLCRDSELNNCEEVSKKVPLHVLLSEVTKMSGFMKLVLEY